MARRRAAVRGRRPATAPRAVAPRREAPVRVERDPHRTPRQRRDGVERTAKPRRVRLSYAEEAVGLEPLSSESTARSRRGPRCLGMRAEAGSRRTERDEIEAKQGARSYSAPDLHVRLRRNDVAKRHRCLVEPPLPELLPGGKGTEAAELQRQSLPARDDEPLRAADELERSCDEARGGPDDSQRVWKRRQEVRSRTTKSRRRAESVGLREEPVRRCVTQPRHAAKGRGNRRRRVVAGEDPAPEVARRLPCRAEPRNDCAGGGVGSKWSRVESARERRLVAPSRECGIEWPAKIGERDPYDIGRSSRNKRPDTRSVNRATPRRRNQRDGRVERRYFSA